MSYALIPDGFTLKKVNKLQKEAVNAKRRHDDVLALLSNPTAVSVFGASAAALALGAIAPTFIKLLEDRIGAVSDDIKDGITATFDFLNPIPEIDAVLQSINPLAGEGGGGPFGFKEMERRKKELAEFAKGV
jgi:hypothetical protein